MVQRRFDLVGFLADLSSTARGSFQSNPTVEALRCSSIARVNAGCPALMPAAGLCGGVSFVGLRAARSAFSSALMRVPTSFTSEDAMFLPCRKNMRVPADHFARDGLDHIPE